MGGDGSAGPRRQLFVAVPVGVALEGIRPSGKPCASRWRARQLPCKAPPWASVGQDGWTAGPPPQHFPQLGPDCPMGAQGQATAVFANPRQAKRHCGPPPKRSDSKLPDSQVSAGAPPPTAWFRASPDSCSKALFYFPAGILITWHSPGAVALRRLNHAHHQGDAHQKAWAAARLRPMPELQHGPFVEVLARPGHRISSRQQGRHRGWRAGQGRRGR